VLPAVGPESFTSSRTLALSSPTAPDWRIRILFVVGNTAGALLVGVGLAFFHDTAPPET
jgi:hypothetical protein